MIISPPKKGHPSTTPGTTLSPSPQYIPDPYDSMREANRIQMKKS